ncbi:hypothetical protein MKK68_03820 [Methylobacterium sp. E-016]|uniref:hypothetical protein n=1 Tax=Methylobacterium sp. E-016 TaxID=2836556 RepID=UPI001FBB88EA|nr:hypothetical protein [Methylobacterium sp. E-016]MCJ2074779.1 hypothetical protein [Methylobacterium sp. E-016]
MGEAPEGAGRWTADRVGEAMIEAFRVLPSMPVYSPRRAEFVPVLPGQDLSPLDVVALSEHVLGRTSPERKTLLLWARSRASGTSFREQCRELGLNRATADRRLRVARATIAAEMNRAVDEAGRALDELRRSSPQLAEYAERL